VLHDRAATLGERYADIVGRAVDSPFRAGVNVHAATVMADGEIAMESFERGVGRTLACGTGACAVAVAAVEKGLASPAAGDVVRLLCAGGVLEVEVGPALGEPSGPVRRRVRLTGPTAWVCWGEYVWSGATGDRAAGGAVVGGGGSGGAC
jgi:diaminopimelate epimerase